MHRRNVSVLAFTVILLLTSRLTWNGLLPTYYSSLGATDAQIGTAFSLAAAALALFQLVGGMLADRVGRKPVAVLPIFGFVAAVAWMAQSSNWQQLLFGHISMSVLASMQSPGFTTLLAESVSIETRGRAFGTISVAARTASAVGPALGAWLLVLTSNRIPPLLWITVATGVVVSLARLLLIEETLETAAVPAQLRAARFRVDWRAIGWFVSIGALYAAFANLLRVGPFVALHALGGLGLDEVQLNLLLAAGNGVAIGSALLGGWLTDRIGHRAAMALGLVLQAVLTLTWALLPSTALSTVCFLVATAGSPIAHIAYNSLLTGVLEGKRRGAFVGLIGMLTGLMGSPASWVGAELRALSDVGPFWAALVLAGLLAAALAVDGWRARRDRPTGATDAG